jgi:hypothetical protein
VAVATISKLVVKPSFVPTNQPTLSLFPIEQHVVSSLAQNENKSVTCFQSIQRYSQRAHHFFLSAAMLTNPIKELPKKSQANAQDANVCIYIHSPTKQQN